MSASDTALVKRERDIRLDFFRGIAMIVILFAHVTDNPLTLWLPGRFGFSDSTEIFVFCSGMASALAFGTIFHRRGWLIGAARILRRIWTVYWVHLGVFFVTLAMVLALNHSGFFAKDEVRALNLIPFLSNTGANVLGVMSLTYVPNYFDILPMYVVLLALVPVMVLLARVDTRLALLASLTLWLWSTTGGISIPAEWWFQNGSTRPWFFNPFAWQLLFFTGYGLMAGWLPAPPLRRDLVTLAGAVVILTVPFAWHVTIGAFEPLQDLRRDWAMLFDKTGFGLLRYLHFLALAYVAWALAGEGGRALKRLAAEHPLMVQPVLQIGRQSLAVFAVSMVLARLLGALMAQAGHHLAAVIALNLLGLFLIWLTAWTVSWFKALEAPAVRIPALPPVPNDRHSGALPQTGTRRREMKA